MQHHTNRKVGNLSHSVYGTGGGGELKPVTLQVHRGDVVRLVVGPKDGSHACDLTHADMTLTETGGAKREWDISKDISGNIFEGNPLKDRHGNDAVWYFYSGKVADVAKMSGNVISVREGSHSRSGATSRTPSGARRWLDASGRLPPAKPSLPRAHLTPCY